MQNKHSKASTAINEDWAIISLPPLSGFIGVVKRSVLLIFILNERWARNIIFHNLVATFNRATVVCFAELVLSRSANAGTPLVQKNKQLTVLNRQVGAAGYNRGASPLIWRNSRTAFPATGLMMIKLDTIETLC
jgi:hypothetical protein